MANDLSSNDHEAIRLAAGFYSVLHKYLPPSTTLGELMILSEVALGTFRKSPPTVTGIAESTGLSRWTIGRIIQRYIENGNIREQKDPRDARRKLLVWTDEAMRMNREWARDLNRMWAKCPTGG